MKKISTLLLIMIIALSGYSQFNTIAEEASHFYHSPSTYTILASSGFGGVISPAGEVVVLPEEDKVFEMIPDIGYYVSSVVVDGVEVGAVESYIFRSVSGSHSIHVQFGTLGIDDVCVLESKVYPNPTKDYLVVEGVTMMKEIVIYDLKGLQLRCKNVDEKQVRIEIEDLDPGIYILKVLYKDDKSGCLRFVVDR